MEVSFTAKKRSDSTLFHYSNEVWGETQVAQCLKFRVAENPGCSIRIVADSNRIVVYHPNGKHIRFSYHIVADIKEDRVEAHNRPRITNAYFHVLGQSLFAVPEEIFETNPEDPHISASIEWVGFPHPFNLHNTFGSRADKQELHVNLWHEFYHSLFVGGDYRIYSFESKRKPVYFAIRGTWLGPVSDMKLVEILKKTVVAQRELWNDHAFDYYTVIMTPSKTQTDSTYRGQGLTGAGLKNGFMIQATNNPYTSLDPIRYVFNHELLHDWIGGKISMRHEELNYWFSEGFTDYYTYKNRLRSGDISEPEWEASFNTDVIKAHWQNPERNRPNYAIKDDFWKSRNVEKIPYRRGALFAFWLDNQILRKSNYALSLDDVMRDILKICTRENRKFTDELFLETAGKYLGMDLSYFFQKHILLGLDLELKDEDLIPEFRVELEAGIPRVVRTAGLKNRYYGRSPEK